MFSETILNDPSEFSSPDTISGTNLILVDTMIVNHRKNPFGKRNGGNNKKKAHTNNRRDSSRIVEVKPVETKPGYVNTAGKAAGSIS